MQLFSKGFVWLSGPALGGNIYAHVYSAGVKGEWRQTPCPEHEVDDDRADGHNRERHPKHLAAIGQRVRNVRPLRLPQPYYCILALAECGSPASLVRVRYPRDCIECAKRPTWPLTKLR
ncbi:hypothetical protein MRX96_032037 [Rhipicephalus microplus]